MFTSSSPARKYYLIHFLRNLMYKTSSLKATKEISLAESWIWKNNIAPGASRIGWWEVLVYVKERKLAGIYII